MLELTRDEIEPRFRIGRLEFGRKRVRRVVRVPMNGSGVLLSEQEDPVTHEVRGTFVSIQNFWDIPLLIITGFKHDQVYGDVQMELGRTPVDAIGDHPLLGRHLGYRP